MNGFERFPEAIRARLDQHRNSVAAALSAAGTSVAEVASVCADLDAHLMEVLSTRPPESLTLNDIEAVLARLDAPEHFGDLHAGGAVALAPAPAPVPAPAPGQLVLPWLALGLVLLGVLGPLMVAGIASLWGRHWATGGYCGFLGLELIACILGLATLRQGPLGKVAAISSALLVLFSLLFA